MTRFRPLTSVGGPAGTATALEVVGPLDSAAEAATVALWLFDCPGQSVGWSRYVFWTIHLRPLPGLGPGAVLVPGATHEFLLAALDPSEKLDPLDSLTWAPLSPFNLVQQVILTGGDDQARRIARLSSEHVVAGRLWAEPPLSGQRHPWDGWLVEASLAA